MERSDKVNGGIKDGVERSGWGGVMDVEGDRMGGSERVGGRR